jgi:SOS-response transcriptional repressor LexA
VADLAGVARSHFWEVMAARRSPTLHWIERVALALEVAPVALFSQLPLAGAPFRIVQPRAADRFRTAVPLLSLQVAAGGFAEQPLVEAQEWVAPLRKRSLRAGMFVARVVGRSMEPLIPDGSFCLFQAPPAGPLSGKIVIAQHRSISDPDSGGHYTIKRLMQKKGGVDLLPLNSSYAPVELRGRTAEQLSVIAEFVAVL